MENLDLATGVTWFLVFLFSTTLHEAGHAWSALRLGDPTAYHGGQVSLNPWPHVRREPFGMVLVPILTWVLNSGQWMVGWASAPYDPLWADRHPRRAALMALAGPAGNLLLVVASAIAIRVGLATGLFERSVFRQGVFIDQLILGTGEPWTQALATVLSVMFSLNLLLFSFNLMPFPPLDGSAAVALVLPESTARRYQELLRQPAFSLIGLLIAWQVFKFVGVVVLGVGIAFLLL